MTGLAILHALPGDDEPEGAVSALTMRWTPLRKAELLERIRRGRLSLTDALRRYGLTLEEVEAWKQAHRRLGTQGLKVTRQPEQGRLI